MLSKTPARGQFGQPWLRRLHALAEERRRVLLVQLRHEHLGEHVRNHVNARAVHELDHLLEYQSTRARRNC